MKILIVGCGYVGAAVGRALSKEGHELWGLRRDDGVLGMLSNFGVQPLKADLLDPSTLQKLPPVDWVLFCQAPRRDSDNYQDTYVKGTQHMLEALRSSGAPVKKILFISSTSVYATHDGSWVDESTDPRAYSKTSSSLPREADALLEVEASVLQAAIPANILRLGGIYGPHRHRVEAIRKGDWVPKLSDAYSNRIHIEDIVSAIRLLFTKGQPGEIYLGVDDEPCTGREFYTWLYEKLKMPLPSQTASPPPPQLRFAKQSGGAEPSNKRCSNKKIKALGLELKYPNYKVGYGSFL